MIPGPPALCEGTVAHRRLAPEHHQFNQPVSYVWIDPDNPQELCGLHPKWSHRRPAPARFRRKDYGTQRTGSLAAAARDDLRNVLDHTPQGPVRMLTQVRRWGWLFNPITIFLVWGESGDQVAETTRPIGAVLEVTSTPWKERIRYPVALDASNGSLTATFDKSMHVSPFLGMDYRYQFSIENRDDEVAAKIDVAGPDGDLVLRTALRLQRRAATRELLDGSLRSTPLPTHRVSAGIHGQAVRLWAKRVPIVPHPRKTRVVEPASPSPVQENACPTSSQNPLISRPLPRSVPSVCWRGWAAGRSRRIRSGYERPVPLGFGCLDGCGAIHSL